MSTALEIFPSDVVGVDIGGANIKMSRHDGTSLAVDFPMWTEHARLSQTIAAMVLQLDCRLDENLRLAVTMTGEMADCFQSRRHGVAAILNSLCEVVPAPQIAVYAVSNRWLSIPSAIAHAWSVASSNWYALPCWLALDARWELTKYDAILDIGSTTVDIIPLSKGKIATAAKTDRQRMQLGQLVYSGMERTPVHAVVQALRVEGADCPVMAEKFATVLDAHLVLRTIVEQVDNCDTADDKPRTREHSLARLARMVGEDAETLAESEIVSMAEQILEAQIEQIASGLRRNLEVQFENLSQRPIATDSSKKRVFVCGHGRPLADRLKSRTGLQQVEFTMLDNMLSLEASRCAPALAVAQLYWQHLNFESNASRIAKDVSSC